MVIEQFYGKLLEACGLAVDESGSVYIPDPDGVVPMTIGGQSLVLPTREVLAKADWKSNIAFHPCSESIIRKESKVLKKLRELVVARTYLITTELMLLLMQMAVDTDCHKSMSPEQSNYLSLLPTVDAKTMKALTSVINASSRDGDHRLISLFIKRSGLWNGSEYRRVAVVTFPILDAHSDNEAQIFGVKMRKGDKQAILSLFEYIYPGCRETGKYSFGSNEMAAPNFHALGYSFAGLLEKLNDKVALFKEFIPSAEEYLSNLDWVEGLESIAKYRAAVPALAGNDGEPLDDGKQAAGVEVKASPQSQMRDISEPVQHAPQPAVSQKQESVRNEPPKRPQIAFTPPPNTKAVGAALERPAPQPLQPVYQQQPQQQRSVSTAPRRWNDPDPNLPPPPEPQPVLLGYDSNGQPMYGFPPAPVDPRYAPPMDPRYAMQADPYGYPQDRGYGRGYQDPYGDQYYEPRGYGRGYQQEYVPRGQRQVAPPGGYRRGYR